MSAYVYFKSDNMSTNNKHKFFKYIKNNKIAITKLSTRSYFLLHIIDITLYYLYHLQVTGDIAGKNTRRPWQA